MRKSLVRKMTKPNCFKCRWKRKISGSSHISCGHPSIEEIRDNPLFVIMVFLSEAGRLPPMCLDIKGLNIEADELAIQKGWFNFPFSFDPVWLKRCDGYEPIEDEEVV